jgi:acyl-CoA synthetase (AMP-forming)/AMP-acid ligase II
VRIVGALPIGPTGKVLKRDLRDQLSTPADLPAG